MLKGGQHLFCVVGQVTKSRNLTDTDKETDTDTDTNGNSHCSAAITCGSPVLGTTPQRSRHS